MSECMQNKKDLPSNPSVIEFPSLSSSCNLRKSAINKTYRGAILSAAQTSVFDARFGFPFLSSHELHFRCITVNSGNLLSHVAERICNEGYQ